MLKIYPFMATLPIGFKSKKDGTIYYYGRPLLNYETFPYPIYDFDRKGFVYMKEISPEYKREHETTQPLNKFKK